MKKNAIILAAGKSTRFAPFTYEKPKGLFKVKGDILIERQIEQLKEAGIKEIIVVVGYMKEKFFYLEEKYGVKLLVNNSYANKGNLLSLYVSEKYLKNTFICCADHYYEKNPFFDNNELNLSYRLCALQKDNERKFVVKYSDANVITGFKVSSIKDIAMVGYAYFNEDFSKRFVKYMKEEIDDFGISNLFWEQFYANHINDLTLYVKKVKSNYVLELNSIEDLRKFDSDFFDNVNSDIINNICKVLECKPSSIVKIKVIQAGLTNISFSFFVDEKQYVYRHPGGTADNLIDRKTELYTQYKAKEMGLDKSLIYMDKTGWKISYFVQNIIPCDFIKNDMQLKKGMDYLRKTHEMPISNEVKIFDNVKEGKKLWKIASATKGNLFKEFKEMLDKIDQVDEFLRREREKYNIKMVVSHNDVYEPNFIATKDGDLYLIDWEYAGIMDPANDICSIFTRYEYDKATIDKLIRAYYNRELSDLEYRHVMGQSIINAFYWVSWGMYKGSLGEEDGFFFLTSYRYIINNIDKVIESYKEI